MKNKLLIKKLIKEAYVFLDTYGDAQSASVLMRRALEELDRDDDSYSQRMAAALAKINVSPKRKT